MLKRLARSTRISVALMMVVSIMVPASVAEAAGTITKQFTVLGLDGQPYANAQVVVSAQSNVGTFNRTTQTSTLTTNSSGVVTITYADDLLYYALFVQPPQSDSFTATFAEREIDFLSTAPATVTLETTSVLVNIKQSDGTAAVAGSYIYNGFKDQVRTLRTGDFGVNIPADAAAGVCNTFIAYPNEYSTGSFERSYASKVTGTGLNRVVKLYSDADTCQVEVEKINGVYQLQLPGGNVSGTLKSSSGSALSLSDASSYKIEAFPLNSDGTMNYQKYVPASYATNNGNWSLLVDTATAGKYLLTFAGFGNTNLPIFSDTYFYVTSDNKFSWNADGSSATNALTDVRNIPTSNVTFSFVDSATSTGLPAYINIQKRIGTSSNYLTYGSSQPADGSASAYLTDGTYLVEFGGMKSGSATFTLDVAGSSITARDGSGVPYVKSGSNFTVRMPADNVKLRIQDAQGNPIRAYASFCIKQCYTGVSNSSGLISVYVPDGTYSGVSINPLNNANFASTTISGTVTNGVPNLSNTTTGSNGELIVQLPATNFKVRIVHPTTNSRVTSAGLQIYQRNQDGSNGNSMPRPMNSSTGVFGSRLSDGDYNLVTDLYGGSNSDSIGLSRKTYRVTVSGGNFSVTDKGAAISAVDGVYLISPYLANFTALVKDPDGNVFNSGYAQSYEVAVNGKQSNYQHLPISNDGFIYTYLETGTVKITVSPYDSSANFSKKSYTAVTSGGVTTVSGATQVGSQWLLPLARPNVLVAVSNPKTSLASSQYWISIESANDSWNNTGWIENIDLSSTTAGFGATKLENGKYFFTVNPHDATENEGLASQTYRVTVADSGITMTLSGNAIVAVNGKFPMQPATSNFQMLVKKASGVVFTNGWVNFCQIIDVKNENCLPGRWLSTDGKSSAFLTNGNWRVSIFPDSSVTDVTRKSYDITVTDGVPAISGLTATNGVWTLFTGTPNLSGNFTLASGTLTFGQNQSIGVELQKLINGNWQYQGIGTWANTNSWALSATGTSGQYRLIANPWNFPDLVSSTSNPFWMNSSGQFSSTENGTFSDSMTAVSILMRTPNLKLKVVNPLAQPGDANYLVPGGWVNIDKVTSNNRSWIINADISAETPGLTGANIAENGTYILRVNPPNGSNSLVGVAAKEYQMVVNGSDSITVTSGGVAVAKDGDRFVLRLATANVSARVMRIDGTPAAPSNGKWVSVNLQKLNQYGDWNWTTNTNTDDNGYISLRVESAGKYRLRIEPYGDSQASVTYSTEFTVAESEVDTLDKKFGSITLAGPSIRVAVATATAPTVTLAETNIEIRKDGRWIDWASTSQGRIAGISLLSEGTYEFIVQPNQDQIATSAKRSYKVIATKNSDGQIVAAVEAGSGVSVANGITTLLLGQPTLSGTVKDPNGVVVQPNSQVYAIDISSGSEKWDYSVTTNYQGNWSMSLPAGKYRIYARAPWGTSEYGTSNGVGVVEVLANGNVTVPNGYSANAFNIRLKAPTWTGYVKAPTGDTVISQARVCLLISNQWNCTNADNAGRFALSMPESFSSFSGTNPILDVADDSNRAYPMNRIQGESAVSQALGGTSSNTVVLRLKAPNTQITVTPSEGTLVASNLWVVAEREGVGYLSSSTTDYMGVAKLNIESPNLPFKVRVEVNGNPEISANFATTTKSFTSQEITSGTQNSVFSGSVTLSPPNFRFVIREPTVAGTAVGNTWAELLGGNEGPWLGSTGVDFNGFGNFKLDVPLTGVNNYTVIVNPSWNATTNFTRQAYAVTVASSGNITVTNKTSVTAVTTQVASGKTVYPLTLGIPSVTGIVVDPDSNTVANSWVVPFNAATNEGYWQQGVNSRNNGEIAMNLASGNYKLEANVPWGSTGVAKSAKCDITVSNGTISTGGACVQTGTPNTVRLALRPPNVKFTLKIGNTPIANANVGVAAGGWWTNAQSNSEGVVSLYVDAPEIRRLSGSNSSQRLWLWVDPPYGSSTMARWNCGSTDAKPICSQLSDVPATGDYVGKTSHNGGVWEVQGVTPNTRLKIVDPSTGHEMANSWVSIFATNSNGNQWWLGGGNSGIDGFVAMNIETETAFANGYNKLVLEVQPPWNQRSVLAANLYTNSGAGYSYESLTAVADFSPATPNLKLIVRDSNNYINRYGWVAVEEINSNGDRIKWVGGYGLNEYGEGAVFLAASKRYLITSYPGPGRGGASTQCRVTTNSATPPVVSTDSANCGSRTVSNGSLTIRLNGGNVVGTVLRADGSPVVGAAVYANIPGAATEASAVITVTDETGHYDLQLTANQSWNLKVFPIPSATDNLEIKAYPTSITAPSNSAITADFTLAAVTS